MSSNTENSLNINNSEIVEDQEKRQYHIGLAPGEVANTVLLVGDPKRAEKVAKYFDLIRVSKSVREFNSFTGTFKNIPITVISTGIGTSNVEIAVIELSRIFENSDEIPTLIRVGSSGSLQSNIDIGDLVISTGAVRLENTSSNFVEMSYPAVANFEVVTALITSAERKSFSYHVGITATASGFYGAQGRELERFPVKDPNLPDRLAKQNVLNFEMESSTLFTLASLANFKAGTVCAINANRPAKTFITDKGKQEAETKAIECGLEAVVILKQMEQVKKIGKKRYWNADHKIEKNIM